MDRNSVIGLLLIGGILLGFSIFNAPAEDDLKPKTEITHNDSSQTVNAVPAEIKQNNEVIASSNETVNSWVPKMDANGLVITDDLNNIVYTDTITGLDTVILSKSNITEVLPEAIHTIENDVLKLEFTTKGGHIHNAYVKDYKSYQTYVDSGDAYLQLLDQMSTYGIELNVAGKTINTNDYDFEVVSSTDKNLTMVADIAGKTVEFIYGLTDGSHDMSYVIKFNGFESAAPGQTKLFADFRLLSTEKYLLTEQRNATFYYDEEGSYDYLSAMGDDDLEFEEKTNWVAFKQLFFSAIVMKEDGFGAGSKLAISNRPEFDSTYLKDFTAELNLGMSSMAETVSLKWYFGPNDYDVLALHDNGTEDIVDLGWGIFRWVNVYAFRPVMNWFLSWGMGAGFAILLLTFFVKLVLSPVNYKMYKSSATMRVLKPEITEIGEKFPKKEDAMKKQQALMALYKDAGASPLAGCVPMLIQMPVLIAIFRLFPSAIELRQKSFLWAEDLSTYDQIASWSGNIPLITWAYGNHISLFTLLMAITTLLYTHFNSSNMQTPQQEGMPNMKYIMYFFPIMMIFWFNSYSSGLSFYYFISTLMTMGIMFAIKEFMLDEDKILAKIAAKKAAPKKKKGKSKFAARLEEAQKLQQERANRKK
ncbi:membrane protein insertase YidC [Putridiphycobacter roseus]|uniref:Membrane protein insertase YidC n=1 Tax=Putridiphycobacter roseus TaxID=2219161 RepID=A0A2W1N2T8_9FLAO|nr:membrane protein insertase YidC [Putridiphycobacter roseus]PZE18184.1 membrane protein insertase YidC [Putridiphycobacter roseus]